MNIKQSLLFIVLFPSNKVKQRLNTRKEASTMVYLNLKSWRGELPKKMNGKVFYTTKEATAYTGVSRATLYNYQSAGRLNKYHKGFSRTVYWSKDELDALQEMRPDQEKKQGN